MGVKNRQPHYRNSSYDECKQFLDDVNVIFGKISRSIKKNSDGSFSVHLPTVIGDLLISFGYTPGDRTKNNAPTFGFLDKVNDETLIAEFLAKAFNDDGYIQKRGIGLAQSALLITLDAKPSNVLLLDKRLLEKIGIPVKGPNLKKKYANRHGPCATFSINIYSKKNMRRFSEKIKLIGYKKTKLERYINK